MQVGFRQADMLGNLIKRRLVAPMICNVGERLADLVVIGVGIGFENGHEGLQMQFMPSPTKLDASGTPETDADLRLGIDWASFRLS